MHGSTARRLRGSRDISAVFTKLDLPATDEHNRRALAVLAFLGLRPGQAQRRTLNLRT